jgi:N-acetylmuramoyl-L-alanine amidase
MRKLVLVILLMLAAPLVAAAARVEAIRAWSAPDQTRLVFDVTAPVEHKLFTLDNPGRLVIDLKKAVFRGVPPAPGSGDGFIARVRTGIRSGTDLRVVLDLKQAVRYKSFLLTPNDQYGHRLVIDIEAREDGAGARPIVTEAAVAAGKPRDIVIAIDAGHGGEDPGALGRKGTREKDVVLAIARKLKEKVDAEPGMKGALVRKGDYYIPLRKRMAIAREQRADFFVSIHADAFHDHRARGSSVYVLSKSGASSEAAKWLAEKENAADLVGGVSLDDKDAILASVLLDLSQTASMQVSREAAEQVLQNLRKLGRVHAAKVQQARFMVLKSPDIPSMLVETAFISNPAEEKKLRDKRHQEKLAKAILDGIKGYFDRYPPPGTYLAMRQAESPSTYVCAPGDTLSEIALRHRISLARLREHNGLTSDTIRVGQILQIPVDS